MEFIHASTVKHVTCCSKSQWWPPKPVSLLLTCLNRHMSKHTINAPVMPKMARNRSALHDVLAQGTSNRDITVYVNRASAATFQTNTWLCFQGPFSGVYTKFSSRFSEEPFTWLIQKYPCILIFKIGQPGCQLNLSEGQIRLDLTSWWPLV